MSRLAQISPPTPAPITTASYDLSGSLRRPRKHLANYFTPSERQYFEISVSRISTTKTTKIDKIKPAVCGREVGQPGGSFGSWTDCLLNSYHATRLRQREQFARCASTSSFLCGESACATNAARSSSEMCSVGVLSGGSVIGLIFSELLMPNNISALT